MIVSFSFENFRSYKNETLFDFQAANIPEHEETIIQRAHVSSLLPVNVIYGPNGGNLLIRLIIRRIRNHRHAFPFKNQFNIIIFLYR